MFGLYSNLVLAGLNYLFFYLERQVPNSMDDDRVPIPKDDEEDIISSYLDGDHDDAPHKVCSIILLNSFYCAWLWN